jgi:AcrR family transcriptional regulator
MTELPKNKEKLLRAAIELFAERGFSGTSIRDIARKIGISISNIYHYFGNKEGLMMAILQDSSKYLAEKLREISEMDLDPLVRFRLLIHTHVSFCMQFEKEAKIFSLHEVLLSREGNEINRQLQMEIMDIYLKELKALQSLHYLRSQHLKVLAFNILGVINWHLRWFKPGGPLSLRDVADESVSFVMNGILKPGAVDGGIAYERKG